MQGRKNWQTRLKADAAILNLPVTDVDCGAYDSSTTKNEGATTGTESKGAEGEIVRPEHPEADGLFHCPYPLCTYKHATKTGIACHMRSTHKYQFLTSDVKKHERECHICGIVFESRKSLIRHMADGSCARGKSCSPEAAAAQGLKIKAGMTEEQI